MSGKNSAVVSNRHWEKPCSRSSDAFPQKLAPAQVEAGEKKKGTSHNLKKAEGLTRVDVGGGPLLGSRKIQGHKVPESWETPGNVQPPTAKGHPHIQLLASHPLRLS